MKIIKLENRGIANIGMPLLMVALSSFLIPTRGTILGISSANLLVLCCVCAFFLYILKKPRLPMFYWIYAAVMIVCMLYHYQDRELYLHFIELMQIIGLVYLSVVSIRKEADFYTIIDYLISIFVIYAIFGIIESLGQYNIFDALTGSQVTYDYANGLRFGLARSRGACGTSINNGMLLAMVLCLIAYRILNSKKKKRFYSFAYALVLINCFCTLSRAVWLDVLISQLLIFLSQRPKKQIRIVLKIVAIAFAAILLALVAQPQMVLKVGGIMGDMVDSIIGTISGNSTSDIGNEGDRLLLWGWVWTTVKNYAVWGVGYATKFAYLTSAGYVKESIEVMWLYRLYQLGFVGLFGYLFLQISCLVYFLRNINKKTTESRFIGFNYLMLIMSSAYFITQFSCAGSEDLRFFYFALGLAFAYNKVVKKSYGQI